MDQYKINQRIIIPDGYKLEQVNDLEYRIVKVGRLLPKTWEEFCEIHPIGSNEYHITNESSLSKRGGQSTRYYSMDKNVLPSEEKAKAILALCQLIQLRDYYNDSWVPDWENTSSKYCIHFCWNKLAQCTEVSRARLFAFETSELRDEFLKNFRGLLEQVKPLFM